MWPHGCSVGYQTSWNFNWTKLLEENVFLPSAYVTSKNASFSWVFHVLAIRQWTKWLMWFAWAQLSLFSLRNALQINVFLYNPKWVNLVGSPKLLLTHSWLKYSQIKLASLGNPSLPKTLCGWAFGLPHTSWEGNYIGAPSYRPYPLCISFLRGFFALLSKKSWRIPAKHVGRKVATVLF